MKNAVELLVEHYEQTYETTLRGWEQRNRTFRSLLVVVGVGTLLTFNVLSLRDMEETVPPLLNTRVARWYVRQGELFGCSRQSEQ